MIIKTDKFALRPFKKGDETSLIKNINNEKIYRLTSNIPYPYTLKDAKKWIKKNEDWEKEEIKTSVNFAIDINGEVIGGIGFSKINNDSAELGYWLGENYWGKSIVTQAVKEITKFGFEKLGFKRIYANVYYFNKASQRVLEKNNFRLEGKKKIIKNKKSINYYIFAKTLSL